MPLRVYLSSTFKDLEQHRAAAAAVLRRMGHEVIGMEDYVAADERPLDRCLADIARSDVYVGIIGWRYGYRPRKRRGQPKMSITEHEYREAIRTDTPRLIFLLRTEAPWPVSLVDAVAGAAGDAASLQALRNELERERLVSFFSTPDELAGLVGPAVYRQEAASDMVRNVLQSNAATAPLIREFTSADRLGDTRLIAIADTIERADESQIAEIALGAGKTWWSTRLFVFADLAADLTEISMLVFTGPNGKYLGMTPPDVVRDRLRAQEPVIAAYVDASGATPDGTRDAADEVHQRFDQWSTFMDARGGEASQKVWMKSDVLRRRLGSSLIEGSITVDMEAGLTAVQMQQILDWPLRHVPITPTDPAPGQSVVVVDRDAFARVAARQYVSRQLRTGR